MMVQIAVTFRYDDMDVNLMTRKDAMALVVKVRKWAEAKVSAAAQSEQENEPGND